MIQYAILRPFARIISFGLEAEVRGELEVRVRLRPPPEEGNACEIQGAALQA